MPRGPYLTMYPDAVKHSAGVASGMPSLVALSKAVYSPAEERRAQRLASEWKPK